ncbi:ribonuclease 3-like protein 1 [Cucumis melo var. makuwa]|uniref:Ribonuclease 3-like protein 1 n=1 Tax=Cucumis melo var. makuwa TaxID=1194695 RepID=A0A5D3E0Z9_CUCMM|nr:ribonuclease 3-like protein 1 [Cucumis melo var. makuwa]TYK29586.1 ribonuclease 3-like protein 1 [Cucumis melo var. makuwa]
MRHYTEIVGAERKNRGIQMEKNNPSCPPRLNINLKNLPPINNPRNVTGTHSSIPAKFEKSRYIRRVPQFIPFDHRPEIRSNNYPGLPAMKLACSDSARAMNTKTIPVAPSADYFVQKKDNCKDLASRCSCCRHGSTKEGTPEKRAAKSLLFEICTANHWQPPLFECCEEEGPSHARKYRFKVSIEMKGDCEAVVECYGNLQTRKKMAAEHAAEGALWYLKNLGYRFER